MGKKKTHEQYVDEVAKINPDIEVTGTYIGSITKIAHRCKIDNNIFHIRPCEVLRGQGCPQCGRRRIIQAHTKNTTWYISEIDRLHLNTRPVEDYIASKVKIKHECTKCGYQWNISPNDILHGYGCPVCAHKIISPPPEYRNSIWSSQYKDLAILYGMSEDQMKTFMPMSNKKIVIPCSKCHTPKNISPNELFQRGFRCSMCSDGISFPNKFMYALLSQLNINFQPEYHTSWSNSYKYDVVNEELSLVIENHGAQHYEEIKFSKHDNMTLKERQAIDIEKERLAKNNGFKHYIVINCQRSNVEWIRSNIIKSELPVILGFSENDINWEDCVKCATSSFVKCAADLWNIGLTILEISKQLKVCTVTVSTYLKQAFNAGLCNYVAGDGMERYHNKRRHTNKDTD